jgi:hypothetical protein
MSVETDGIELRQDVNAIQAAVEAIGNRNIDDTILAGQRDGRFGPHLREGVQAGPLTAAEHERDDIVHCDCGPETGA